MTEEQVNVPGGLVPMEAELQKDAAGDYRQAVLRELATQASAVKKAMDAGAPPEEFSRLESMARAIETASTIVDRAWKRFHPA